jgi:dinuclear metal center YbgI/SA1388 family protein
MANLHDMVAHIDDYLAVPQYPDFCPNGLQVEGKSDINKIVTGVTACQALLDKAVELNADAVIVHHGYFWKNESPNVVGFKRKRLHTLLNHEISLLGYHLPLDVHLECGNNSQLAVKLDLSIKERFDVDGVPALLFWGQCQRKLSGSEMVAKIKERLQRAPLYVPGKHEYIDTVVWCTGAGQRYIEDAVRLGAQAFITGEASEQTVHIARETGIHFYACGHHATERYGVEALGNYLAGQFGVEHQFIDIDNPA